MPPLPRRVPFAALFVVAALLLCGCGSGRSADVADSRPVAVSMSEFRLDPQQLRIGAGRRSFEIRNDGTVVHRFELRSADGSRRLARSRPLKPGERTTVTVSLRPGDYLMRCGQERHNTLGEWGTVTVTR